MRREFLVDFVLLGGDGEDDVDGVLLDFQVDLRDARVILDGRVRVHVLAHMASSVVGGDDTAELSVSGVMEACVR